MKISAQLLKTLAKCASTSKGRESIKTVCIEKTSKGMMAIATDGIQMVIWAENDKCISEPQGEQFVICTDIIEMLHWKLEYGIKETKGGIKLSPTCDVRIPDVIQNSKHTYPKWREVCKPLAGIQHTRQTYSVSAECGAFKPGVIDKPIAALCKVIEKPIIQVFPALRHEPWHMVATSENATCEEVAYAVIMPAIKPK